MKRKRLAIYLKSKSYDLSFLHSCRTVYKSQPQKWVARVYSGKIGQPVSRFSISRLHKKYSLTKKRIIYHYLEQLSYLGKIKLFVNRNY